MDCSPDCLANNSLPASGVQRRFTHGRQKRITANSDVVAEPNRRTFKRPATGGSERTATTGGIGTACGGVGVVSRGSDCATDAGESKINAPHAGQLAFRPRYLCLTRNVRLHAGQASEVFCCPGSFDSSGTCGAWG